MTYKSFFDFMFGFVMLMFCLCRPLLCYVYVKCVPNCVYLTLKTFFPGGWERNKEYTYRPTFSIKNIPIGQHSRKYTISQHYHIVLLCNV